MAIEVTFCTATRTDVPVGPVKFDVNRCNESPLRSEKPDFRPVSKFNTGNAVCRFIDSAGEPVCPTPKLHRCAANVLHICNKTDMLYVACDQSTTRLTAAVGGTTEDKT